MVYGEKGLAENVIWAEGV